MNAPYPNDPYANDPYGPAACPLCATPVWPEADRCSACGTSLLGHGGRPGPFGPNTIGWWVGALVGLYLLALLVVAAAS